MKLLKTAKLANLTLIVTLIVQLIFPGKLPVAQAASKPNLVVIMTDDLDIVTYRAAMNAGLLKNIKQHIVDKGVSFDNNFVTNAVCCPSRATMLSGQYTQNHGVKTVFGGILYWLKGAHAGGESNTMATWLQGAGYRTVHVGKYLNGYGYSTARDYIPPGYNEWYSLLDPSTYRVYNYTMNESATGLTPGTLVKYPDEVADQYQTDVLSKKANAFVNNHFNKTSAPFFMVLAPIAPHVEVIQTPPQPGAPAPESSYLDHFAESIRPAPRHEYLADGNLANGEAPSLSSDWPALHKPSFNYDAPDAIDYVKQLPSMDSKAINDVNEQFKHKIASMAAVDDMVGTLVDTLSKRGQLENTVILFTGDNGYFFGEHKLSSKLFGYDESIRVPLVIRGPGFAQGVSTKKISLNIDIAPTMKELGLASGTLTVDGRSLVPILRNPSAAWTRKQFLIEHYVEGGGVVPDTIPLLDLSPPTFKAVRRLTDTEDYLYVEWNEKILQPNTTTFWEFFPLNDASVPNAKFQMTNRYSSLTSSQKSALQSTLASFRGCKGSACRTVEDK